MHETIELSVALVNLALEKGTNQAKTAYFLVLMPLSGIGALASRLTDQTLCKTFFLWRRLSLPTIYSRTPVIRTLKGNEKEFELAEVRVIGVDWIFNLPC